MRSEPSRSELLQPERADKSKYDSISLTGELLATSDIEVNGQREKWYDRQVNLTKTSGVHDVIIRFVHPQQASGLMNLDSIYLQR